MEALVRRPNAPQQQALRGRIILAAAGGKHTTQSARELQVRVATVRPWRTRWIALQATELADLDVGERLSAVLRPGRPSESTAAPLCQLVALACDQPKERPLSHWTGRAIADEVMARGIVKPISPRHAARVVKKGSSKRL